MPLSVIIPIPKMTGETQEVRSDKRRREEREKETSQELGNCPMGQREALLKERLY